MKNIDRGHSLHAFTKEEDSTPTLYVVGQIKAKGDFVGIELIEIPFSEQKPHTIGLQFMPDEYDPNGPASMEITPFNKTLNTYEQYNTVVIESQQGYIHLEVERVKTGEKLSYAGGGSDVPHGVK